MNILIAISNLGMGGPTRFILRLAQELGKEHKVFIYDLYPYLSDVSEKDVNSLGIGYLSPSQNKTKDSLNWKINSVLKSTGLGKNYWEKQRNAHINKSLVRNKIEVVLGAHRDSDFIVSKIAMKLGLPFIIRLNSNYGINENETPSAGQIEWINSVMTNTKGIIYTADFHFFKLIKHVQNKDEIRVCKIMNGIPETTDSTMGLALPFETRSDSFIFGMVARGDKEKGWIEAVQAFNRARNKTGKDIHLVLVGEGETLDQLKKENNDQNIHFVGFSKNPGEWIHRFHVGLLPTYFINESTPNVLIEYLQHNKPVIATNYVEIPYMMSTPRGPAGIIVDRKNGIPDVEQITRAMVLFTENHKTYMEHCELAKIAFEKFDMNECANLYSDFLQSFLSHE